MSWNSSWKFSSTPFGIPTERCLDIVSAISHVIYFEIPAEILLETLAGNYPGVLAGIFQASSVELPPGITLDIPPELFLGISSEILIVISL